MRNNDKSTGPARPYHWLQPWDLWLIHTHPPPSCTLPSCAPPSCPPPPCLVLHLPIVVVVVGVHWYSSKCDGLLLMTSSISLILSTTSTPTIDSVCMPPCCPFAVNHPLRNFAGQSFFNGHISPCNFHNTVIQFGHESIFQGMNNFGSHQKVHQKWHHINFVFVFVSSSFFCQIGHRCLRQLCCALKTLKSKVWLTDSLSDKVTYWAVLDS